MSISYPLTLPAAFKSTDISLMQDAAVAVVPSPFTKQVQVQAFAGQRITGSISLAKMKRENAEQVVATLWSLNGRQGTFYCGDTANKVPRGTALGTPKVNGAATARSSDLATKGWTAGSAVLKMGDWIQIGTTSSRRLHKVLADATADGSGNVTLSIWPWCREAYANNTSIVTASPTGVFRLSANPGHTIDINRIYSIQVGIEEDI